MQPARALWMLTLLTAPAPAQAEQGARAERVLARPNIVLIFTDDQGYGDVGVFGASGFETPHLDRLAREGMRMTSFYVAQPVCSASRAALMTGCYPNRIGILGALGPRARHGIHENEVTIAEICKQKGYATAIYGKWHLGHHPKFLPVHHGFDDYYGLPYSNDMWPHHPTARHYPDLPMVEDDEVIDPKVEPVEQIVLTTDYTERALKFIDEHRDGPFFLYLAHSMPHVPLHVSDKFKGKSEQGLYGDVIMEIDWSVGQIVARLEKHRIDRNTLVIFTSDNGPWLSYGNHAGSAGPLREGKGTTWEGGVREPAIFRWPGKIPAGAACDEVAATIDVLPTIAALIGAELPPHKIDGRNIWPLLAGVEGAKSPHAGYCYYQGRRLQAIRSGRWKLHFPHAYRTLKGEPGKDGKPGLYEKREIGLSLFDLKADIGERENVADRHPDVVRRLQALADTFRQDLGDAATKVAGSGRRPPGRL